MNGARGLVIATAAAFIVGCSVGLMGGILFMRFAAPGPHGGPMFGAMRGPRPPIFGQGGRGGPGGPGGPGMPGGPERMMPWLERTLDLSPAQRERIVAVLDRARHEQVAVRESVQVWIERELTPEQRERWKQMEERFERSRRGRWPRGPMPPDRP
ncbi:MAG: hypothetical protein AAB113_09745 [Candidatus Eisenbacteria bacterium]